jgi:hypothetical protein
MRVVKSSQNLYPTLNILDRLSLLSGFSIKSIMEGFYFANLMLLWLIEDDRM